MKNTVKFVMPLALLMGAQLAAAQNTAQMSEQEHGKALNAILEQVNETAKAGDYAAALSGMERYRALA